MPRKTNSDKAPASERFLAKKSLGQNFLTSDVVPRWMCDAAEIKPGETVVEIGPGTGVLTKALLQKGARVIAIETDQRAVKLLQETFATEIAIGSLTLIAADVREISLSDLGLRAKSYKVVANIPYYLSGFLLRTFLENECSPETLVFLMQKEVVSRIAREPKGSILAMSVKAFGDPKYVKTVSKGHFDPKPKIDSAILAINNISHLNFNDQCPRTLYFELLHLGFGQKRKQLISNLSKQYDREDLGSIFSQLSIDKKARAEDLSLATWLSLTASLHKLSA